MFFCNILLRYGSYGLAAPVVAYSEAPAAVYGSQHLAGTVAHSGFYSSRYHHKGGYHSNHHHFVQVKPQTPNLKPQTPTPNPKPQTSNPKPQTPNR